MFRNEVQNFLHIAEVGEGAAVAGKNSSETSFDPQSASAGARLVCTDVVWVMQAPTFCQILA